MMNVAGITSLPRRPHSKSTKPPTYRKPIGQ
jgi:hypothetical protein